MTSFYDKLKPIWYSLPYRLRRGTLARGIKHHLQVLLVSRSKLQSIYDQDFFDRRRTGADKVAPLIAQSLMEAFSPGSVLDVGCGTGELVKHLQSKGAEAVGLEGAPAAAEKCRGEGLEIIEHDLRQPPPSLNRRFDLVTSLEVAEHLPQWVADRFVDLLCSVSDRVVLTAAHPGQGGHGHLNEQPQTYWIEKFEARDYRYDKVRSDWFRTEWSRGEEIPAWYSENVMCFLRNNTD